MGSNVKGRSTTAAGANTNTSFIRVTVSSWVIERPDLLTIGMSPAIRTWNVAASPMYSCSTSIGTPARVAPMWTRRAGGSKNSSWVAVAFIQGAVAELRI